MANEKPHHQPANLGEAGRTPDPQPLHSPVEHQPTESTPAEERGERLDHGRAVARGGKQSGSVPGAGK